jgi:hypothetical protein
MKRKANDVSEFIGNGTPKGRPTNNGAGIDI